MGCSRLSLYIDAAASFWREWVINYDVTHQQTLGEGANQSRRRMYNELRQWYSRNYQALLESARRTHQQIAHSPGRWPAGGLPVMGVLLILMTGRPVIRCLAKRSL